MKRNTRQADQKGATLVLITIFAAALFGFAALSIDVSRVFYEQRKTQNGTDAAAYAAAAMLTNADNTAVINEAKAIALANGVKDTEISAGATTGKWGNYPGAVQVGNWDPTRPATNRFIAGQTPRNAVRVPARRNVPLFFAPVVGLRTMGPVVVSVATLELGGMVPFGLGQDLLTGVSTNCTNPKDKGCQITINKKNSGNWGKLNLGDALNNPNYWYDAFVNGYNGTLGPSGTVDGEPVVFVDTDPGFAKLKDAWEARRAVNPIVVMPVPIEFFNGRKTVTIIQYAAVKLLDQSGGGDGWKGNVQLLGVSSTPTTFTLSNVRKLVQ